MRRLLSPLLLCIALLVQALSPAALGGASATVTAGMSSADCHRSGGQASVPGDSSHDHAAHCVCCPCCSVTALVVETPGSAVSFVGLDFTVVTLSAAARFSPSNDAKYYTHARAPPFSA